MREREVHRALREYTKITDYEGATDGVEKICDGFVLKLLKKLAVLIAPQAFATTLAQHESSLVHSQRRKAKDCESPSRILRRQLEQE
jgi:hypothetical protein